MAESCDVSTSHEANGTPQMIDTVLFAEFDIDKGSTLRESYPQPIAHYSPEFFADTMLPEGVHNREEDFTIFFLNRQNAPTMSPASERDNPGLEAGTGSHTGTEDTTKKQPFMYCLSVVRTTYDNTVRRGARVKAVAICSPYKFCFAFKDVLDIAVRRISFAKGEAENKAILKLLYDVINAVDISGARNLSDVERRLLKRTVSSAFNGPEIQTPEDAMYFHTQALWEDGLTIPLKIKLCSTEDQHDMGLLKKLLTSFGEQTMMLFNAVLTGARVIVLGYNQPAGEVCSYVLSMSALVCPPLFGLTRRQFPYANLTDLGFLSAPGYIAGVTNPMFKSKKEWWDVLCDISTGEILHSSPVEKEEFEAADKAFVLEVLDGIHAGHSEEWVRCMFEEYTRQNVVDIAFGEAQYVDTDTQVKRIAMNNKRITRWARTDNYKLFADLRNSKKLFTSAAFNYTEKTGIDLKKHIRVLQGDIMHEDTEVERIYADFVSLLTTEEDLLEFLSYLPLLRGGLHTVAQGIFHSSMSVKYNTVVLLKRLESHATTQGSLRFLNAFLMMTYQRIHGFVDPASHITPAS